MEGNGDGAYPTRHDILDRSGSEIHYWVTGLEDGPLVAFTHGATMDYRMFDPQVGPVVNAGYRVLTWNVRGHRRSKPIGDAFTAECARFTRRRRPLRHRRVLHADGGWTAYAWGSEGE